jgi:high-affinity nickel-transport protein
MGMVNLHSALSTKQHTHTPIAFKGAIFKRFFKASSPASILVLGALFAVSFDTLSQTAMFAATTSQSGGWLSATALALLFTVGMMLPDAVNGFWLSKILRRANAEVQFVSRLMGTVIAGLSLTIGCINLARFIFPSFGTHIETWQMSVSIALVLIAAIVFPAMLYLRQCRPMAGNDN